MAAVGSEADYYDDYGFDYSAYDDQLGAVGDFLSDLNPEFLATVSFLKNSRSSLVGRQIPHRDHR